MLPLAVLRGGLLGLVAMAAVAVLPQAAAGSIRVSPLLLENEAGDAPARLGPVHVTNTSGQPVPVQVTLAGLTHDPDGYPVFLTGPEHRELAMRSLCPSWTAAELSPGETRELWFNVHAPPAEGAYLAALVSAPVPTGSLVVAVLLFLRGAAALPQPPLQLEAVWAEQRAPNEPVQVVARLRNAGMRDAKALGEALLVGPNGQVQARLSLGPATVLPGAVRLLRAEWHPALLPAGRYVVQASLGGQGGRVQTATAAFDVVRPYELASLSGSLSLSVRPGAGGPPVVVATLHNRSPRPAVPVLDVRITGPDGRERQLKVRAPAVEPGAVDEVELPWPSGLGPGQHRVEVAWVDGVRRVAEAALSLSVAPSLARGAEGRPTP